MCAMTVQLENPCTDLPRKVMPIGNGIKADMVTCHKEDSNHGNHAIHTVGAESAYTSRS
jgi:hypothetical protein